MKLINGFILGAAIAAFSLPADAAAQGNGKGKNKDREKTEECRTVLGRTICSEVDRDDRDRDRARQGQAAQRGKNGKGPKFCQTGQGHPVHGREWCREKGFGIGSAKWERAGGWGDIIFGRQRTNDRRLDRRTLSDVLGGTIFGRLDSTRRSYGLDAPLTGYWTANDLGRVLMVESGGFPIAQFQDRNRDGRVDAILINRLQ